VTELDAGARTESFVEAAQLLCAPSENIGNHNDSFCIEIELFGPVSCKNTFIWIKQLGASSNWFLTCKKDNLMMSEAVSMQAEISDALFQLFPPAPKKFISFIMNIELSMEGTAREIKTRTERIELAHDCHCQAHGAYTRLKNSDQSVLNLNPFGERSAHPLID
jgi:hypothetical protein